MRAYHIYDPAFNIAEEIRNYELGLWRHLEYRKMEEKLFLSQYHNLFRYVSSIFPENLMLVSRCRHIKIMILHSIWQEKCSFCIYECGLWRYLEYLKIEEKLDLRQYHNLFRYVFPTFSENFMLISSCVHIKFMIKQSI